MARTRPALFIGSSTEGLRFARALQVLLDNICEITIWSQGIFGLGQGTLESLVNALEEYDFAILVLTADDLTISRDVQSVAPRDNVLFELGLFMGGLGRNRTFIVYDRTAGLRLPSDLAGVCAATFAPHTTGNLQSALGAAATRIEDQIIRLGVRDKERLKQLAEAARKPDSATSQMQRLVEPNAHSRKVELDITAVFESPETIGSSFQIFRAMDGAKKELLKQFQIDLATELGNHDFMLVDWGMGNWGAYTGFGVQFGKQVQYSYLRFEFDRANLNDFCWGVARQAANDFEISLLDDANTKLASEFGAGKSSKRWPWYVRSPNNKFDGEMRNWQTSEKPWVMIKSGALVQKIVEIALEVRKFFDSNSQLFHEGKRIGHEAGDV